MCEYFMETSGCQPRLYVFSQIFYIEENFNFEQFRSILEKEYETSLQQNFLNFWSLNADNIVSEEYWMQKENSTNSSEVEPICLHNSLETVDNSTEDNMLWQHYYEKVYTEQYQVYAFIFYEYYKHLHKSLEAEVEVEVNIENRVHCDSILSELEQLQLLGLPTAFGGKVRKRERNSNKTSKLYIYSGFFSDEESTGNMDALIDSELIAENQKDDIEKNKDKTAIHDIKTKILGKNKKKNRKLRNVPEFILENKGMLKYWRKRFSLFSRYDEGIRLDCESWFSVTPEKIAVHLADRLSCDIIIDAFCGCGGNSIQFARTCKRVVAIDIDPIKLSMAKHNASVYGVADKIDFILGDYLKIGQSAQFRSDVIFLSPPWGGPKYKKKTDYDIENYLQPAGASELMKIAKTFSKNVVLYLPRNSYIKQVVQLAGEGNRCEVEHNYLDSRLVAISAIYGESLIK